jgi:hypothetical protein
MEALPYEDHSFDILIAANSLQYAANRIAALHEFRRVSETNATLVLGLFGPTEDVEYRAIFSAIREALPEPPPGAGPFELSAPGVLEALIEEAGLSVQASHKVDCPFHFKDQDSFLRSAMSGGPIQGARRALGDERLRTVLRDAAAPFRNDDSSYTIAPNYFKYVVASPV